MYQYFSQSVPFGAAWFKQFCNLQSGQWARVFLGVQRACKRVHTPLHALCTLQAESVQRACTRSREETPPSPLSATPQTKGASCRRSSTSGRCTHRPDCRASDATREDATVSVADLAGGYASSGLCGRHARVRYERSSNLRDAKSCFQWVRRVGFEPSRRRPLLRCSTRGAWHGCSDPTPKRQRPPPNATG